MFAADYVDEEVAIRQILSRVVQVKEEGMQAVVAVYGDLVHSLRQTTTKSTTVNPSPVPSVANCTGVDPVPLPSAS